MIGPAAELVGGRFRVLALLGSGGTASVYEAIDVVAGGLVALKVLHPHLDRTPGRRAAFLREASVAGTVDHPSVVRVVATADDASRETWTAWTFASGVTLAELVRSLGPLDPAVAFMIVDRVLGALDSLHAAGFVHRDISASNVLVHLGVDGGVESVTLIDFGLADRAGRSARSSDVLLNEGGADPVAGVVGNPAYASPEHLRGEEVGIPGDLYQVGGLLHFALVGEPPFVRGSTDETILAHLSALPPTVSVRVRGIPVDVDRVVVRALLKHPSDRFPSAAAMQEALSAAAHAAPRRSAQPAPPATPAQVPRTRLLAGSPAPVDPVAPDARAGASPMMWVLLSGAVILLGTLVFALVPRGGPLEAREPVPALSAFESPAATPPVESSAPAPSPSTTATVSGVAVPSVIGRSEADARDLLAAVGLRVTATPVSMDGPDAAGTVVATSPAPGDVTTPGASVALTVASGFETVPDVRGMTADRAQYEVASAGFAIALQRAPSEVVPAGTVMEVDPAVGTRAAHGSRVTLVVSTGPAASAPTPAPTSAAPSATPSPETTAEAQR